MVRRYVHGAARDMLDCAYGRGDVNRGQKLSVIEPYVSAGSFKFGASYDEIVAVLGEPRSTEKDGSGEMIVRYDGFGATISSHGVVEVYFLPDADVWLSGIDIFGDPGAFQSVCALDGDPKETVGVIVLLKLGITMTGFHDGDASQLAITAFEKGRMDELRGQMQDYRIA